MRSIVAHLSFKGSADKDFFQISPQIFLKRISWLNSYVFSEVPYELF